MEDVRINRQKRYTPFIFDSAATGLPEAFASRRAGRTALLVYVTQASLSIGIQRASDASTMTILWQSTTAELSHTFTLEEMGDAITEEFFVTDGEQNIQVHGVDVYLDLQ